MKGRPGTIAPHGTNGRYVAGCGCDDCRRAHTRYNKQGSVHRLSGRPGLVDSTGTARRLQALAAIGWGAPALADRLGVVGRVVQQLRGQRGPTVERATAEKIAALYDELCMTVGTSSRARCYARRFCWVPPLAWDDDELDDPAAQPHTDPCRTTLDLDEWHRLVRWGEDPITAAARCGVGISAVQRAAYRAGRNDLAHIAEQAERRTA